ncbi:MAG TPA: CPBP family intramembrane glutamic endopeptidase [Terracidiphilus sp.]|nr:CPBP family intramembrane glutamic endopeptidase [Terracidiphilus sp.]
MEPDNQSQPTAASPANYAEPALTPPSADLVSAEPTPVAQPPTGDEPYHGLRWIFIGPQGLRAGWSVFVFFILLRYLSEGIGTVLFSAHLIGSTEDFSPGPVLFGEAGGLLALLIAIAIVGLLEGRRIPAYNLTGPRRPQHFFFGVAAGFLALSALVGTLAAGGWLHFGPIALSGTAIFRFGLLWGCVFLIGACFEEGMCRCYLLFTLTRGINFWWALGSCAYLCARLAMRHHFGGDVWGVYAAILVGLIPCFILHQKAAPRSGFWCAAWVTSAYFGYMHVSNPGETWIGILAAAFIGFVFCVSVRLTGSAWWAIGCHAGWDWAETYFYGTADSGLTPQGCYLTSHPAGNPLWSGGAVGPEGSLLVLAAILFLLALVLVYGRWSARALSAPAALKQMP